MSIKNNFRHLGHVLPSPYVEENLISSMSSDDKKRWIQGFNDAKAEYRQVLKSADYGNYRKNIKQQSQHLSAAERALMIGYSNQAVIKLSRHRSNRDFSYIAAGSDVYRIEKTNNNANGATAAVKFAYDKSGKRYVYITKENVFVNERINSHRAHKRLNMNGFIPRTAFSTNTDTVKMDRQVDPDVKKISKNIDEKRLVSSKDRGILPYMGVTLGDYLKHAGHLNDSQKRILAIIVLEAIIRFEKKTGLMHRDLAPDNICIDSNFNVSLIDFESCVPLKEKDIVDTKLYGKPDYLPDSLKSDRGPPVVNGLTNLQLKNFATSKIVDEILSQPQQISDQDRMTVSAKCQVKKLMSNDQVSVMETYLHKKLRERRLLTYFSFTMVKSIFWPRSFLSTNKPSGKLKAALYICELFSPGNSLNDEKMASIIRQIKQAKKNSRFIRCTKKMFEIHYRPDSKDDANKLIQPIYDSLDWSKRRSITVKPFLTVFGCLISKRRADDSLNKRSVLRSR